MSPHHSFFLYFPIILTILILIFVCLYQSDLQDLQYSDSGSSDESSSDEDLDPIAAERKRRSRKQDHLRRSAGEPMKPEISEILKLQPSFLAMLRCVLAD